MLSTTNPNKATGRPYRQHRRQQSTPTGFEAVTSPAPQRIQKNVSHRRGMSVDQIQRCRQQQGTNTLSNTNQGFYDNTQQILQEAQQHSTNSRVPPFRNLQPEVDFHSQKLDHQLRNQRQTSPRLRTLLEKNQSHAENSAETQTGRHAVRTRPGRLKLASAQIHDLPLTHLASPSPYNNQDTPTMEEISEGGFDQNQMMNVLSHGPDGQVFATPTQGNAASVQRGRNSPHMAHFKRTSVTQGLRENLLQMNLMSDGPEYTLNSPQSTAFNLLGSESFPTLNQQRSPFGRRVSGGIMDQVMKFENLASEDGLGFLSSSINIEQDQLIGATKNMSDYGGNNIHDPTHESVNAVVSTLLSTSIISPVVVELPMRTGSLIISKLPNRVSLGVKIDSAPMPTSRAPVNFMNTNSLNLDFGQAESFMMHVNFHAGPNPSPTYSHFTAAESYQSSPEIAHTPMSPYEYGNSPEYFAPPYNTDDRAALSSRQSSPTSPAPSGPLLNIEETQQETGVTSDDISKWIKAPETPSGKWTCMFPGCPIKKPFGRKENIKSHVQTHLNDRQFVCPVEGCHKPFVRQHDLKRHFKNHSGDKPYACDCGRNFVRHDALTRHRQRGMCEGAFEGAVRSTAKRGRPRKERPDIEERMNKASKTRSKNRMKSNTPGSSRSGDGMSSGPYSPNIDDDGNEILDPKPFANWMEPYSSPPAQVHRSNEIDNIYTLAAASPIPVNCVSPQAIQNAPSPAYSQYSSYPSPAHNAQYQQQQSIPAHSISSAPIPTLRASASPIMSSPFPFHLHTVAQNNNATEFYDPAILSSPTPGYNSTSIGALDSPSPFTIDAHTPDLYLSSSPALPAKFRGDGGVGEEDYLQEWSLSGDGGLDFGIGSGNEKGAEMGDGGFFDQSGGFDFGLGGVDRDGQEMDSSLRLEGALDRYLRDV